MSSLFIAIEGAAGVGKSTQVKLLADRLLRTNGHEIAHWEFPRPGIARGITGTAGVARQCVLAADRYATVPRIQDILRRAGIAIVERWKAAGRVEGLAVITDSEWIDDLQSSLPDPDLNILLDLATDVVWQRANLSQPLQRGLYRQIWKTNALAPGAARKWQIVNGEMPIEQVHETIFAIVARELAAQGY